MKQFLLFISVIFFTLSTIGQEKKSTASENIQLLEYQFTIPEFSNFKPNIWIYLPPDYNTSSKKYPVIYMHDAQNLFDAATSFAGEWEVDETLNAVFEQTKKGFIVIGIENSGEQRINQYTPWENKKYGGGKGFVYVNFLIDTLKPFIDSNYRTKSRPKHTALIGSSLGGLISYYGGLKHPNVFGKIGALSTSFWFSEKVIEFTTLNAKNADIKLFLLVGGKEGEEMENDTKQFEKLLLESGFNPKNLKTVIKPEGNHNEGFWKSEFLNVVTWLYNIN
ncbi:alpha/beta hydrolase [Lutibacter sp.]|uniref:alpha/beta hydrolase n=1 Tax=Lutibacter sp. TaxID=1925666 RepID=UPI002736443C|nr:alpha/beta hydrolase-fold protein [Lutibacter sp.]MDP3313869.1 alpha/beta hydrolase-fold protein [Lutibacter sp.]